MIDCRLIRSSFAAILVVLVLAGCSAANRWNGSGDIDQFLRPEFSGMPAHIHTASGSVRGTLTGFDPEERVIHFRTQTSAFDGGETLSIAFENVIDISVLAPETLDHGKSAVAVIVLVLAAAIADSQGPSIVVPS